MSLLRRIEKGQSAPGGGPAPDAGGGEQDPEDANKLTQMRVQRKAAPTAGSHADIKSRVQTKLLSELDPSMNAASPEFRSTVEELFATILAEENIVMSRSERNSLFDAIIAEILGFGPLETLLADDSITEIMVYGPKNIYIEE
jgi:pilus assembly protein CpaF